MNFLHEHLGELLRFTAVMQLVVAALNLFLVRMMKWQEEVAKMPPLVREVFHVHGIFITASLVIFGVVTLRFADELVAGSNPLGSWLAAGIGIFWTVRTVMQWTFYSSSHWKGQRGRTVIHWVLTAMYGTFAGTYLAVV